MSIENKNPTENSKENGINLSPEQKAQFENYLKSKGESEPINFSDPETQRKLMDFRKEIEQKEKSEYTNSSSEILAGTKLEQNFGNKENFEKFTKTLDNGVYGYFFGGNGILKNLQISESEKKSFSAGSGVFLIDSIYNEAEKSGNFTEIKEEIIKILGKDGQEGDLMKVGNSLNNFDSKKITGIIGTLKNLLTGNIVKIFSEVYDEQKINIISESLNESNLKNNQIFSNPKETFNFFENIFKNNLDKNASKNYIESKNSENIILGKSLDLKEIGNKLGNLVTPEIGESLGLVGDIGDFFTNSKDKIRENLFGNKEILKTLGMLSSMPIIGNFIKMLLGFFNIDMDEINAGYEEKTNKIKESISKKDGILEGIKFEENFAKKSDGKYDGEFINNILELSGNNNENKISEDLEKYFKKGGDFDNFTKNDQLKKLPDFGNKNNLKDNSGKIIFENLKYLTNIYKEYLNEKNNNKVESIEDFINKKLTGNQNMDNEIYGNNSSENNDNKNTALVGAAASAIKVNRQQREEQRQQNSDNSNNNSSGNQNNFSSENLNGEVANALNQTQQNNNNSNQTNRTTKSTERELNSNNETNSNPENIALVGAAASAIEANRQQKQNNTTQTPKNTDTVREQTSESSQNTSTKKLEQNNFLINKNENIEFLENKISFVFDVSGKKYEATLFGNNKGNLTIVGNGEKVIFNGAQELFGFLNNFRGKLNEKATGRHFGETGIKAGVELNGKTVKQVLINGLNENVSAFGFSEHINKPGLKQIITNNFVKGGNLAKNNVNIGFGDKNFNLNFEKNEGQKLS